MKKLFFLLFLLIYSFTSVWTDFVSAREWVTKQEVVTWLYENWLTKYSLLEDFWRDRPVARWEIVKFFVKFSELKEKPYVDTKYNCNFNDIEAYDYTLKPYILEACRQWIMVWNSGNFFPERHITDAEWMTVLTRIIFGMQDESRNPRWQNNFDLARSGWWLQERINEESLSRGLVADWLRRSANQESNTKYDDVIWSYLRSTSALSCPNRLIPLDGEISSSQCHRFNEWKENERSFKPYTWYAQWSMCVTTSPTWGCWRSLSVVDSVWADILQKWYWPVDGTKIYFIEGENFFTEYVRIAYKNDEWDMVIDKVVPDAWWRFSYALGKTLWNLYPGSIWYTIDYVDWNYTASESDEFFKERYPKYSPTHDLVNNKYRYYDNISIRDIFDFTETGALPDLAISKVEMFENDWKVSIRSIIKNVWLSSYVISSNQKVEFDCSFLDKTRWLHINLWNIWQKLQETHEWYIFEIWSEWLEITIDSTYSYESERDTASKRCRLSTPYLDEVSVQNNQFTF